MKTGYILAAAAVVVLSCGGNRANTAVDMKTRAGTEKSGNYLTRGTFFGGEVTDGKDVHDIEWSKEDGFERLTISIYEGKWMDSENAEPAAMPCMFTVTREEYPPRLVVTVGGTRMFSARPPDIPDGSLVRGYYRIIYLDDAGHMFAFGVEEDTEFEVFERRDPAAIVIDVRPAQGKGKKDAVEMFSLRTYSFPAGERLGHLEEWLWHAGSKDTRILIDSKGQFCVEEGLYPSRIEAEKRLKDLPEDKMHLLIEGRKPGALPRNIPRPEDS